MAEHGGSSSYRPPLPKSEDELLREWREGPTGRMVLGGQELERERQLEHSAREAFIAEGNQRAERDSRQREAQRLAETNAALQEQQRAAAAELAYWERTAREAERERERVRER